MSVNLELKRYKVLRILLFIVSLLSIVFAFYEMYGLFFAIISLFGISFLKHNDDKSKLIKVAFWIAIIAFVFSFGFMAYQFIDALVMSHNSKLVFDMI